jgi:hypothetical protein
MTYQTYAPNNTKHWTTWLARVVGLIEMLLGIGIILLGLYTIITAIVDLGDASDTILGQDLTALFGGLFLFFMGGLILVGAIILFIGFGLWNLTSFSWALNLLGVLLYVGNELLSLPATIDPLSSEIVSLVVTAIFGVYLILVRSKFQ